MYVGYKHWENVLAVLSLESALLYWTKQPEMILTSYLYKRKQIVLYNIFLWKLYYLECYTRYMPSNKLCTLYYLNIINISVD